MTTLLQISPIAHVVILAAVRATSWMVHPALSAQHRDSGQSQCQNVKVRLTGLANSFLVSGQHTEIHIPIGCWLQTELSAVSHIFSCDLLCLRNACSCLSELLSSQSRMNLKIQCTSAKNKAKDRKILNDSNHFFLYFSCTV